MKHIYRFWVIVLVLVWTFPTQSETRVPTTTTLFGRLVDLTCASRGIAQRGSWQHAENHHATEAGEIQACATQCLKAGQPAALFDGKKITAVFACSPQKTLADYAAQEVEVQGFWAGTKKDAARAFVPKKIRRKNETGWITVDCGYMHE